MSQPAHLAASQTPQFAPGNVLAGRYRLEAPLGSGGMADVFRATDLTTGAPCAVKVLRANVGKNPDAVTRLRREGEVLAKLQHPAIVRIEHQGELPGGVVFLTMELLSGETLGARMRRGLMDPTELCAIVTGTCAGLAAAHAIGVVHRDLKPDNIFLLTDPQTGEVRVKLLDFGISKVYGSDKLTQTGEVLGTPRYMSPEQLGAETEVDPRIDAYSLGVILYEALCGKPPFLATTPTDLIVAILNGKVAPLRTVRPDIAPAVDAVVMRAMARARQARFASVLELADAFLDAAGSTSQRRPMVRKGLATAPMGAMKTLDESGVLAAVESARAKAREAQPVAPSDPEDAMQPGTFSAFEAIDEAAVRAKARGIQPPNLGFADTALGPSPAPPSSDAAGSGAYATAPQGGAADAARAQAERSSPVAFAATFPAEPPQAQAYGQAAPAHASPSSSASSRGAESSYGAPSRAARSASASASRSYDESPYVVPTRGPSRMVLIAVGLVAGAVTAAVVVGGLLLARYADSDEPASSVPATTDPTAEPSASASGPTSAEAEGAAPVGVLVPASVGSEPPATRTASAGVEPSVAAGVDAPAAGHGSDSTATDSTTTDATTTDATTTDATATDATGTADSPTTSSASETDEGRATTSEGHPGHRRRTDRGGGLIIPPSGESDRNPGGAAGALQEAAAALAEGDFAGCVDVLEPIVRGGGGGPVALRRYADCLMRAGRREDAISQYQRICRVVPDHPMIGELREQLAGMGRSCP